MRVRVYWNLHKKVFSVLDWTDNKGRLLRHLDSIVLMNCKLIVQPDGQARVRREKKKYVHAFIEGDICTSSTRYQSEQVRYNPYFTEGFVNTEGELRKTAECVFLTSHSDNPFVYASVEEE